MKPHLVQSLKSGQSVEDVFVLTEKNLARKRDGNPYLTLRLSDRTGTIKGVVWDNVEQISGVADPGDYVRIAGTVSSYGGGLQVVVNEMDRHDDTSINPADFIPSTPQDVDQMFGRLVKMTDTMGEPFRALLNRFWDDPDFVNRFKSAPAAKLMHHAYLGGLLEHCLSMVILADKLARHYTGIDRDLLLAGAVLHDIGKVSEFDYRTHIDYSDEGRLLGHIFIGLRMVEEKIAAFDHFPADKAMLLKHLIISHHGALEFGSPELPKTMEAVLLHYIDEIDSKINGIREFIGSQETGDSWTNYHRLLGRHFFMGPNAEKT